MNLELEYKTKRILSHASQLANLAQLGAPEVLIENELDILKKVIKDFEVKLVMDVKDMQGNINVADTRVLDNLFEMYYQTHDFSKVEKAFIDRKNTE
ncbi:hypothetical protein [Paenibacillus tianjinensis]|uniref:Spo0E like sporulation regulatory protein n=1 Tax=Paenibacillus tianjinensis TaxID=2810347 RepID=A0ABX7L7T9_9BACL|nr:hypothetical protein [Paenibacillus tianjinensis]QSF43428.1 hypothetical protein JRJ22_19380 [Paenibacillus tianjinensis]